MTAPADDPDLPFDGYQPYDTREEEAERVRQILAEELPGVVLFEGDRTPVPAIQAETPTSPSLERMQAFYRRSPNRTWQSAPEERYRLYRSYPVEIINSRNDNLIIRHVTIVYRKGRDGVTGRLHSYEA